MLNDNAAINAARGLANAAGSRYKTRAKPGSIGCSKRYTRGRPLPANETKWALDYLKQTDKPWAFHVLLCANEFLHVE